MERGCVKLEALPHGVYLLTLTGQDEQHSQVQSREYRGHSLSEVEKDHNADALVTTNEGKFYSNGLDLRFAQRGLDHFKVLADHFHNLLDRVLCFPIPTVAAICGHASAGGCMLALAHDFRVMQSDRGFIFLNEVEINLHMTPEMMSLVLGKLTVSSIGPQIKEVGPSLASNKCIKQNSIQARA